MHWILGIALTIAVFVILKRWGALSAEKKKTAAWKMVLVVGGALLVFMVLTGRVHVLTAAVAALLPLLRKLPMLLKFMPMVRRMTGQNQSQSGGQNGAEGANGAEGHGSGRRTTASYGGMGLDEACDTLGLTPAASREEIIGAHRRLIQKMHPDRGGNDYLAAKINEAKSVMLKHCSSAA